MRIWKEIATMAQLKAKLRAEVKRRDVWCEDGRKQPVYACCFCSGWDSKNEFDKGKAFDRFKSHLWNAVENEKKKASKWDLKHGTEECKTSTSKSRRWWPSHCSHSLRVNCSRALGWSSSSHSSSSQI